MDCSVMTELFNDRDTTGWAALMGATLGPEGFDALPANATLLVPTQAAVYRFISILGFTKVNSLIRAMDLIPGLQPMITSVVLYSITIEGQQESWDWTLETRPTAFQLRQVGLVYSNGTEFPATAVEAAQNQAAVLDAQDVCGFPTYVLDNVLLPQEVGSIPPTNQSEVVPSLEALGADGDAPPVPHPTPMPPPPMPPSSGCPYESFAQATSAYPQLQVLDGMLKLANLTSDVLGTPTDKQTLFVPTSSAMLDAIAQLGVTDQNARLFISRVPGLLAYWMVNQALPPLAQAPNSQLMTVLAEVTSKNYQLVLRSGSGASTAVTRVKGKVNMGNIVSTVQVCSTWIYSLDQAVLPAGNLIDIPEISVDSI